MRHPFAVATATTSAPRFKLAVTKGNGFSVGAPTRIPPLACMGQGIASRLRPTKRLDSDTPPTGVRVPGTLPYRLRNCPKPVGNACTRAPFLADALTMQPLYSRTVAQLFLSQVEMDAFYGAFSRAVVTSSPGTCVNPVVRGGKGYGCSALRRGVRCDYVAVNMGPILPQMRPWSEP